MSLHPVQLRRAGASPAVLSTLTLRDQGRFRRWIAGACRTSENVDLHIVVPWLCAHGIREAAARTPAVLRSFITVRRHPNRNSRSFESRCVCVLRADARPFSKVPHFCMVARTQNCGSTRLLQDHGKDGR